MGNPRQRQRLPLSFRLKNARCIRRIVAEGHRVVRAGFVAHWLKGQDGAEPADVQVAFVASRRTGAAVVRNRIRRRLREAVRLNREYWPAGAMIVLRARGAGVADSPFASLLAEMNETLRKIGAARPDEA